MFTFYCFEFTEMVKLFFRSKYFRKQREKPAVPLLYPSSHCTYVSIVYIVRRLEGCFVDFHTITRDNNA